MKWLRQCSSTLHDTPFWVWVFRLPVTLSMTSSLGNLLVLCSHSYLPFCAGASKLTPDILNSRLAQRETRAGSSCCFYCGWMLLLLLPIWPTSLVSPNRGSVLLLPVFLALVWSHHACLLLFTLTALFLRNIGIAETLGFRSRTLRITNEHQQS
jgi:hypothetical protein